MNSDKIPKDNTILLTLPNVSVAENESGESSEKNEIFADVESTIMTTMKQSMGEYESSADDHDEGATATEEERISHQIFRRPDRLSPELQDVYKILMRLPSFSHSSWDGFNAGSPKRNTFSPVSKRKISVAGKSRKTSFATGKNKFYEDRVYLNSADSLTQDDTAYYETHPHRNAQPSREAVKMHSINLYQSILPSSLFVRRKPHK